MGDYVYPGVNRALSAFGCLHMAFNFAATLRRFVNGQLDVVNRIAPRLTVDAQLDCPRSEQHVLADRADNFIRTVGIKILRVHDFVLLVHLGRWPQLSARAPDDYARWDNGRPRQPT